MQLVELNEQVFRMIVGILGKNKVYVLLRGRNREGILLITFLDTRKVTKEYALAKELLKLCCVTLRQNNSLEDSLKQILSFTLHSTQFLYAILLMSEK